MISVTTAARIWKCYREILTAEKLLDDMDKEKSDNEPDPHAPRLKDAFGRERDLQLGVPSGDDCHRLFDVSPELALSVIRAHIAEKQAELVRLNEMARIEVATPAQGPST